MADRGAVGGKAIIRGPAAPADIASGASAPAIIVQPLRGIPVNPETAVQHQLDAYNARDLERFLAVYADDVQVFRPPSAEPTMVGKAALAEFHASQRFHLTGLRADLVGRLVAGSKVFDHERVHGIRDQAFDVVAAYEVREGLIRKVWFFSAD
jgi:hypothetical protein